jgi:uncharacterized protein YndB with AHSA1/START domain
MKIEHRIKVTAPPERVFSLWADVTNWHTWDPDTKRATLEGPFQTGSRGRLTPTKGNAVPMLLTSVVPNKSFTVESKIPLFRMIFEHETHPTGSETEVIHRVSLSGFLSFLIGPMLRKQLNAGLPVTLANLKRRVEANMNAVS